MSFDRSAQECAAARAFTSGSDSEPSAAKRAVAPLWVRAQVQVQASWTLFPPRGSTWRKWLFDPGCWLTLPHQPLTLARRPGGEYVGVLGKPAGFYWLSAALCVLGLDVGLGIFYRPLTAEGSPLNDQTTGAEPDAAASLKGEPQPLPDTPSQPSGET